MAKHPDWQRILDSCGAPLVVDFPVVAVRERQGESSSSVRLALWTPEGERYGVAFVRPGERYPGCRAPVPFSHYLPLLSRAFDGLRALGRPEEIRLHVLKAVCVDGGAVYLLKFIIQPEHAIEGSQLETIYSCPLRALFEGFLCLGPDLLDRSESIDFVVGRAIHQGYRWAASAQAQGGEPREVAEAYRQGVITAFTQDFAVFLRKVPRGSGPLRTHTVPLQALGPVVRRCLEKFGALAGGARLYHERLFYAPHRGISGRVDRLLAGERLELYELKTHASGLGERDPRTGACVPGGMQAVSYHEALRALAGGGPQFDRAPPLLAAVELYESPPADGSAGVFSEVALESHPLLTRAQIPLDAQDDRYLDLIAQNRNIGYLAESGLLTGYDRGLIADLLQSGRRLRGVGGSFEFSGSVPPCSYCPGQSRGVCEDALQYHRAPPMPAFFRRVPDTLYRHWAWFHTQVRAELNSVKQHLHRLGETALEALEREGICIAHLEVARRADRLVRLQRAEPIETRLREGDTVLLSADDAQPADGFSVEGRLAALGTDWVEVELADPALPEAPRYRADQLAQLSQSRWQAQGVTDFLVGAMASARVHGRSVAVGDLPWLARVLLGVEEPSLPAPRELPHLEGVLNERQREAIGCAVSLPNPGLLLVQGPPGTGKTQWIAHLVHEVVKARFLAADDVRPVLILTNTHRAANEVVRKIDATFPELEPYVVRLGRDGGGWEEQVARHVLARRLDVARVLGGLDFASSSMEPLLRLLRKGELLLEHAAVFVGTLGSVAADEIRGLAFAYTIVDEAGQATEPATLQALRHFPPGYLGRLVLVGDHKQLPPVVPDDLPAEPVPEVLLRAGLYPCETMRTSLFERLARRYPGVLLTLTEQYRMASPICRLVGDTFYEGRLQPGNEEVAGATLAGLYRQLGWAPGPLTGAAARVFAPETPVVFVDTSDDPEARESGPDLGTLESRDNPREAALVAQLLAAYLKAWPDDAVPAVMERIGVISPYRRQNNRIRQALARELGPGAAALRVDTVDRFQGGERDILVVSLVSHARLGRLHREWRRMNVSLSRAMRKLVVVGCRRVFCQGSGDAAEEEARAYYRRMFETLDTLAAERRAEVVDARLL